MDSYFFNFSPQGLMRARHKDEAIYNLIQELDGVYRQDVELVDLKEWKDKLEESNKEYENLLKQDYKEETAKNRIEGSISFCCRVGHDRTVVPDTTTLS